MHPANSFGQACGKDPTVPVGARGRGGYTPLVVGEMVRNGTKRKEIEAFPLERNGAPTASVRDDGVYTLHCDRKSAEASETKGVEERPLRTPRLRSGQERVRK